MIPYIRLNLLRKCNASYKTSQKDSCFNADYLKFLELIKKYQTLYKSVDPLRKKLGLPQSNEVKPICN